jgi:hypothetical protein
VVVVSSRFKWLLAGWLALQPACALARAEVPIHEVDLPDGMRRFTIQIEIDGKPLEASLDTGSTGLRVLAPALSDAAQTAKGSSTSYGYESGAEFRGHILKRPLALGGAAAPVELMRVEAIGCRKLMPDCRMKDADVRTFRIGGDMLPGQGFQAIFGIDFKRIDIDNPLIGLGVARWIVDLPRSPSEVGKLILDPDDGEAAAYKLYHVDERGMFAGCIFKADEQSRRICAPTLFDSGAPGIHVVGGKPPERWSRGTDVLLAVGDRDATSAIKVTLGRYDQAARFFVEPGPPEQHLSFGLAPYLAWSVLYDPRDKEIGLSPR